MSGEDKILSVKDLKVQFESEDGVAAAVDGVSFDLAEGETLGLVGESGCGKTVTCLALLRLVPVPPGRIVSGQVWFRGIDLLSIPEPELRQIRGNEIAMVFQEPMTALNPVFTCGDQIAEAIRLHQGLGQRETRHKVLEMLRLVGIPDPERRMNEYPHQLSGGLRQRVMIAMALACRPKILICDEPTTALDVTVQAQILALIRRLQAEMGMAVILITHDLGVVAQVADRVAVMYAGKVVETASVRDIYHRPRHPYTIGLQNAVPVMGKEQKRLIQIEGIVPNPVDFPPGCRFHPRCPAAVERCRMEDPPLVEGVACWQVGKFIPPELYRRTAGAA